MHCFFSLVFLVSAIASAYDVKKCASYPFVQRPVTASGSQTFRYHYQIYRKAPTDGVTVVYIPGGPGDSSMSPNPHERFSQIPADMGVILTDARGVACNSPEWALPAEAFSTEQVAADLLAVIQDLQLDPEKTIIHGFSYGTVVATKLAHLNQKMGNKAFHSVVLEGVFGRATRGSEYKSAFVSEYQKYVSEHKNWVPLRWLRELLSTSKQQGLLEITDALVMGGRGKKAKALDEIFYKNESNADTNAPTLFSDQMDSNRSDESISEKQNRQTMYAKILCTELQKDDELWRLDWDAEKGLVLKDETSDHRNLCQSYSFGPKAYDSVHYQLRENLVYIIGENDPATPLTQGLYHYRGQKLSEQKNLFVFRNMGHPIFKVLSHLSDPSVPQFWSRLKNHENLDGSFESEQFDLMELK